MAIDDKVLQQYKSCREDLAYSILKDWKLLRFKGEDHLTFLQGQTTNDVLALTDGQGQASAILDSKAKVISLIYNFRCKDCLYMLLPAARLQVVAEHLDKYAVMDEVDISQPDFEIISISGPKARTYLEELFELGIIPHSPYEHQQFDWKGTRLCLQY